MKFLEDNSENLDDLQCGKTFRKQQQRHNPYLTKKEKGKLDCIKTKNVCPVKDIKRMTEKPQMGKNLCKRHT